MSFLDSLSQDLRYAVRALARQPTYAIVVIATLGLGIAGNSFIFSVMNPYLLRDLPFDRPDELVQLSQYDPVYGSYGARLSMPMVRDWAERSEALEQVAAYHYGIRNLADDGVPQRAFVGYLTANTFRVLGVEAALGRTFGPGDAGRTDLVVLEHGLWRSRYGADPGIVGRTIRLDGVAHTVLGVMPERFTFPWNEVRVWTPMGPEVLNEARESTYHIPVARLRDGWTGDRARAELEAIQAELAQLYPEVDGDYDGVAVEPLRSALNFAWEPLALGFPLLLGAVAFVLLIVCVNVASLTLARAVAREQEVAVRAAMGAGRGRLIRQMLTESGVLAVAGGLVGLGVAWVAISLVGPNMPDDLFRVGTATLDGTVLAYTAAVVLATVLLFGLTPALTGSRADLTRPLRSTGRGSAGRLRGRRILVVAEVALAVALVAGAGLMFRSLAAVQDTDLGFRADRLLTVEASLPESQYESDEARDAYFRRIAREAEALPGVQAAGVVYPLPMNHENFVAQFAAPGREPPDEWPVALASRVSDGYFRAMGILVRAGRPFNDGERAGDDVVIVSRALARQLWGESSALGRTLLMGDPDDPGSATVVGVVDDIQHADLQDGRRPHIYRPMAGYGARRRFLVLAADRPAKLTRPLRDALLAIDPDLPLSIRPMNDVVAESTFVWSVGSLAFGSFGAFAMLLAALGIYGVIAYSVQRRRREMGIRMALGAHAAAIRRLVVGEGLRLALIGLALGLALAVIAGRLMSAILFGVSPVDPLALGGALALFLIVAAASSAIPAVRASRAEPGRVLREE